MSEHKANSLFQILLVEDNPGDARLLREAFREVDKKVRLTAAGDGEEALAILRGVSAANVLRPHLILLDLNLPRMSGCEFLAEIKADAELRRIPVLVLTSSRRDQDILACYDLHANCCIAKPLDFEQFLEIVRSIEQFWLTVAMLPPGG